MWERRTIFIFTFSPFSASKDPNYEIKREIISSWIEVSSVADPPCRCGKMSGMGGFSFYSLPFRGRRIIKTSSSAGGKRGGGKRCITRRRKPRYRYMTPFACDCASDRVVTQLQSPPSANDAAESPLFPCSVIGFFPPPPCSPFIVNRARGSSNSENSPFRRKGGGPPPPFDPQFASP